MQHLWIRWAIMEGPHFYLIVILPIQLWAFIMKPLRIFPLLFGFATFSRSSSLPAFRCSFRSSHIASFSLNVVRAASSSSGFVPDVKCIASLKCNERLSEAEHLPGETLWTEIKESFRAPKITYVANGKPGDNQPVSCDMTHLGGKPLQRKNFASFWKELQERKTGGGEAACLINAWPSSHYFFQGSIDTSRGRTRGD